MRRLLLLLCLLCLCLVLPAAAQSSEFITLDQPVTGEVSAQNVAPSYFFEVDGARTLYTRLTTTSPDFTPVLLLVNVSDNAVLATLGGFERAATLTGELALPAPGQYYLQVQGGSGSSGNFMLLLSDSPITDAALDATPETAPDANSTPAPTPDTRIDLPIGTPLSGLLDPARPQATYRVPRQEQALVLTFSVVGVPDAVRLNVQVLDEQGEALAALRGLPASAVVLPGGGVYTVLLRYDAAAAEPPGQAAYSLRLDAYDSARFDTARPGAEDSTLSAALPTHTPSLNPLNVATNTPSAPTPTLTPIPSLAPSDIDLAIRWNGTYLLITNVSGAPVNIRDLSFDGANRHADADYWEQLSTVNLNALPPGACVGFRPLAYPDAPPLASGCSNLAAWWVSDSLAFWLAADTAAGPGTFQVSYNGQPLATCYTNAGACSLDMPNG